MLIDTNNRDSNNKNIIMSDLLKINIKLNTAKKITFKRIVIKLEPDLIKISTKNILIVNKHAVKKLFMAAIFEQLEVIVEIDNALYTKSSLR